MSNRITIQTTDELDRTLEKTRELTGRASRAEVVRDGLELYDLIIQHLQDGKHLYLGLTSETAGEIVLPHLERAAGRQRPVLTLVAAPDDAGEDSAVPAAVASRIATPAQGLDPHAK